MSNSSDILSTNIYEEVLNEETTLDLSGRGLETVPKIKNHLLCVLYLQNNKLTTLPDELFPSLPSLMWLDLRDNLLTELPRTVNNHPTLTHLLLQNNKITSLPNELGSVKLKVLQLSGNPLMYPPREVVEAGLPKLLQFLNDKFLENMFDQSQCDVSEGTSVSDNCPETVGEAGRSYNSVIDQYMKKKPLVVQLNDKTSEEFGDEFYSKVKGKCPKLAKSRHKTLACHLQSAKYLKTLVVDNQDTQLMKIKRNYMKDLAIKKHKECLAAREKILQDRKNAELLRNWQKSYRNKKAFVDGSYKLDPNTYPYDTNPEYLTFLTREDIEKDLPDKYKKKLIRKCKPTVPRKSNNDVHLALKIKQLFDNLEAIDLNKKDMTPRTEQKVLLNEIQKITEIKQKLMELSTTNTTSVEAE